MVRSICKDTFLLSRKAEPAVRGDEAVGQDLLDTLAAHSSECIGMAANMIGVNKAIIVVSAGPMDVLMYNPVITKKTGPYEAEEGCLSLTGTRKTTRYQQIEVEFQNASWKKMKQAFSGLTAEIIQHEVDHLQGVLI